MLIYYAYLKKIVGNAFYFHKYSYAINYIMYSLELIVILYLIVLKSLDVNKRGSHCIILKSWCCMTSHENHFT